MYRIQPLSFPALFSHFCFLAVLTLGFCMPLSAQSTGLALWSGDQPVTNGMWTLGDDLYISVATLPNLDLTASLVDEFQRPIATTRFNSGGSGQIESVLLWFRSGVVGCDFGVVADPGRYLFRDFDQLEAFMAGRTVKVQISSGSKVLDSELLTLNADAGPRYFFSDAGACPRSHFKNDEDVYLSGRNADCGTSQAAFFLVEQENVMSQDDDILEVRSPYLQSPQTISSSFVRGDWTQLLWAGADSVLGDYGAILRHFDGLTDYKLKPGDIGIGVLQTDGKGEHGISIVDSECMDETCD